jgi:hypothetical protein
MTDEEDEEAPGSTPTRLDRSSRVANDFGILGPEVFDCVFAAESYTIRSGFRAQSY